MSRDFDGNVIVVTGGSTGLGRAIAVEVAKRGAKTVVINYSRNVAEAEETADLVRGQGAEPILVQADVSDDAACRSIARTAEPYGRINALFNNAGVTKFAQDHADMDAVSTEDFLRLYHVNVVGAYQMIRAARTLLAAEDLPGAAVNTSSLAGDSGVGNRVFAQIAQFMGNTEYRGKVIWFLLTCRPDLLPVDLKRQGRAEEHIALFYPDTQEERLALLRAMQRKVGMKPFLADVEKFFLERAESLSGADIEAVLVRSHMRSSLQDKSAVDTEDLKASLEDFIPPYYPTEIDLQILVAVLECTSRSLLPKKYRDVDRSELIRATNELLASSRRA